MKRLLLPSMLLMLTATAAVGKCPISFHGSDAAKVGILIRDIRSGRDIVNYNSHKLFSPASTMKLVTSAAAISNSGPDFRYTTNIYSSGKIQGDTLCGDLIVETSGDPTLYSEHFPENSSLITDVRSRLTELGISNIAGDIVILEHNPYDQGQVVTWEIDDLGYSYGAGYYNLNYADNIFTLHTADATAKPSIPGLQADIEPTDGYFQRVHGINSSLYILKGKSVMDPKNTAVLPMPYPADAFALALSDSIEAAGISFVDGQPLTETDSIPLATAVSPSLEEILHSLMVRSDNMMAESTLRLMAPDGSHDDAIQNELKWYTDCGIDCSMIDIRDGSGLTRTNLLSPEFLASVLKMMSESDRAEKYISLFPRAGVDGTMKSFLADSPLKGRLALKTGSMAHVRCYAGYLLDKKNKPSHIVIVMVNDYLCKTRELNKAIGDYLLKTLK